MAGKMLLKSDLRADQFLRTYHTPISSETWALNSVPDSFSSSASLGSTHTPSSFLPAPTSGMAALLARSPSPKLLSHSSSSRSPASTVDPPPYADYSRFSCTTAAASSCLSQSNEHVFSSFKVLNAPHTKRGVPRFGVAACRTSLLAQAPSPYCLPR